VTNRYPDCPYEYTIKLIKSTILIRRVATPNLFTITSYLLPRVSNNPHLPKKAALKAALIFI